MQQDRSELSRSSPFRSQHGGMGPANPGLVRCGRTPGPPRPTSEKASMRGPPPIADYFSNPATVNLAQFQSDGEPPGLYRSCTPSPPYFWLSDRNQTRYVFPYQISHRNKTTWAHSSPLLTQTRIARHSSPQRYFAASLFSLLSSPVSAGFEGCSLLISLAPVSESISFTLMPEANIPEDHFM
jgi:hypothetical protein